MTEEDMIQSDDEEISMLGVELVLRKGEDAFRDLKLPNLRWNISIFKNDYGYSLTRFDRVLNHGSINIFKEINNRWDWVELYKN